MTLKEIARQLDLAPSTVSRALANKQDISKKTRKAVQSLAKSCITGLIPLQQP